MNVSINQDVCTVCGICGDICPRHIPETIVHDDKLPAFSLGEK